MGMQTALKLNGDKSDGNATRMGTNATVTLQTGDRNHSNIMGMGTARRMIKQLQLKQTLLMDSFVHGLKN